ncbi:interleukin-7 isoform X2 [Lissotriton helveticus]
MLVLLPVGSPTCEDKDMVNIMEDYANVLVHQVKIVTEFEFCKNCCKKEEPEGHRKHVCNDTMEIISLSHMGCALRKLARTTKHIEHIKDTLVQLSIDTERVLSCRCENKVEKRERRHTSKKTRVKKRNQKICVLMEMIDNFKSCWDQLMGKYQPQWSASVD